MAATWPDGVDVYQKVIEWLDKKNIEIVSPSELRADFFQTKKEQRIQLTINTKGNSNFGSLNGPVSAKNILKLDSPLFMKRKNANKTASSGSPKGEFDEKEEEQHHHPSIFSKKE